MVSPEIDKRGGDTKPPAKRKRNDATAEGEQVKTPTQRPPARGPESERTCPHCAKVISTKRGLAYHLDNKVCQKTLKPPADVVKVITPRKARLKQGPAERTCPFCSKVIANKTGLKYHIDHRVCRKFKTTGEGTVKTDEAGEEAKQDDNDERTATNPAKILAQTGPIENRTCPHCSKVIANKTSLRYHVDNFVCRKGMVQGKTSQEPVSDRTCPNCSKIIATKLGLKYHIENMLCRKDHHHSEPPSMEDKGANRDDDFGDAVPASANEPPRLVKGRGPDDDRTCPHCSKVIASKLGLQYHLENFVCRKEKATVETLVVAQLKRSGNQGPVEDRTCPYCRKIISRKTGLQYHIDNFVCRKDQRKSSANRLSIKTNDRTCPICNKVFKSVLGCKYHVEKLVCKKIGGFVIPEANIDIPLNQHFLHQQYQLADQEVADFISTAEEEDGGKIEEGKEDNLLVVGNHDKCDGLETKKYSYESLLDAAKPLLDNVAATAMAAPVMALLLSLTRIAQNGDTSRFWDKDCAGLLRQFSEEFSQPQVAYPKTATWNTVSNLPATLSCRFCNSPSCPGIQACIQLKKLGSHLVIEQALTLVQKIDNKTMVPRAIATIVITPAFSINAKWVVLHEVFALTTTEKLARVTLLGQSGSPLEGYVQILMMWNIVVMWIIQNSSSFIKGIELDD